MKKVLFLFTATAMLLLFSLNSSYAVTISFDPVDQDVLSGEQAFVDIVISGLGDYTPPSLGMFDLDILFDPTVLSFNSAVYGDPVLGDQLDLSGFVSYTNTIPEYGNVNLFELSFDSPYDLDTWQAGSFTLATLSFDTLALGSSSLDVYINSLSDAWASPLYATVQSGNVNVVPEPGTLLLVGSGLAVIGFLRKRKKQ